MIAVSSQLVAGKAKHLYNRLQRRDEHACVSTRQYVRAYTGFDEENEMIQTAHMARAHYDDVRNALEQEKGSASGEYKLTCIDLIQRIDEDHQTQDDRGMSFEEALVFVGTQYMMRNT